MTNFETLSDRLTEATTAAWREACENRHESVTVVYDIENDEIFTRSDAAGSDSETEAERRGTAIKVHSFCEELNEIIDEYADGYGSEWIDAYLADQSDEIDFIVEEFIEKLKAE